jgi:hypothetical protein
MTSVAQRCFARRAAALQPARRDTRRTTRLLSGCARTRPHRREKNQTPEGPGAVLPGGAQIYCAPTRTGGGSPIREANIGASP